MNTSEVLNRAADIIEERGWGTGNKAMRMDGSPVCLEGGIAAAMGIEATEFYDGDSLIVGHHVVARCPAYVAVKNFLSQRWRNAILNEEDADLWAWNDTVAESAAEVVEVLRAAAVIEAAREAEAAEVQA